MNLNLLKKYLSPNYSENRVINRLLIYHDALLQNGGAESVALHWAEAFHQELNVIAANPEKFSNSGIKFNTLLPFIKKQKTLELIFPLIPLLVWLKTFHVRNRKFLISTTGVAHYVSSNRNNSFFYVHSPTRWIWEKESFEIGRKYVEVLIANVLRPFFKRIDIRKFRSAKIIIVNSNFTKSRVREIYNRDSIVLFPPAKYLEVVSKKPNIFIEEDFYMSVGRAKGYKGFELLTELSNDLKRKIIFVGEGTEKYHGDYVIGMGFVEASVLKWLYENAISLVAISQEDFGLTPVEAAYYGCPTVAFRNKGYLDSVRDGVSGLLVENENLSSLIETLRKVKRSDFSEKLVKDFANEFSVDNHMKKLNEILNG